MKTGIFAVDEVTLTSLASSVTRKLLYTVGHKLCADLGAFARQRQTLGLRGVLLTDGDTENNLVLLVDNVSKVFKILTNLLFCFCWRVMVS